MTISINHISKSFGKVVALKDFTCSLTIGKATGIIGPNGSGKSTLLNHLIGVAKADSGSIDFPKNLQMLPIGLCPEESFFYDSLSIIHNLELISTLRGNEDREEISRVIELMNLEALKKRSFKSLSLGQKQRTKIAASLLGNPEIIILDEPHNGLDPPGFIALRKIVKDLKSWDTTLLIASHLLTEIRNLCDEVILIDKGELRRHIDLTKENDVDLESFFQN